MQSFIDFNLVTNKLLRPLLKIKDENFLRPMEIISASFEVYPTSEAAHLPKVPTTKCFVSRTCL